MSVVLSLTQVKELRAMLGLAVRKPFCVLKSTPLIKMFCIKNKKQNLKLLRKLAANFVKTNARVILKAFVHVLNDLFF